MIENYIEDIIQDLSVSHAVSSFRVLKTEIGEEDGYIRIENNWGHILISDYRMEFWGHPK